MDAARLMFTVAVTAAFVAAMLLMLSAALWWRDQRLTARLARVGAATQRGEGPAARLAQGRAARLMVALSRLSAPMRGLHDSTLGLRLANAGLRGERAPLLYYAARTLGTLALPLLVGLALPGPAADLSPPALALAVTGLAVVGYLLPDLYLRLRIAERRRQIREGLPDMSDLLLVCVESGLALDAAINRVAREMALRSPALAEEFHLAALEIRAGARRVDALHNLAARCALDEVGNLVAMLVQSEQFGTGLGDALRVHADFMRVRRMQQAEELAAKIPLKILFPLILLIFPSLLVVILGPAMIRLPQFLGSS